jgi:glucokinase
LTAGTPAVDKASMSSSDSTPVPPPWVVGDIGATNLRFAVAEPDGRGFRLSAERRFLVAEHAGLESALSTYLRTIAPRKPRGGALAVAGPVLGDAVEMTNTGWRWSTDALRQQLGFERLACLNDVEAQALALPHLGASDLRPVGRDTPPAVPDAPCVVVAPGSGLGVSALVTVDGRTQAIAGEGGHVTMAPETEFERAIYDALAREHERVSWERVLSGPGIEAIHRVSERIGTRKPSGIDAAAIAAAASRDACAREAIATFGALLGAYAGDLALIFGARGGVYFGGGILPAMADTIAAGPLRLRFESKGRFRDYLRAIPTAIITHPHPGLIGAAARLASMQGNDE